jgi:hypothetical protein
MVGIFTIETEFLPPIDMDQPKKIILKKSEYMQIKSEVEVRP